MEVCFIALLAQCELKEEESSPPVSGLGKNYIGIQTGDDSKLCKSFDVFSIEGKDRII